MIKKPTFMGSILSVLLLFSVISYAQNLAQQASKTQLTSQPPQANKDKLTNTSPAISESEHAGSSTDDSILLAHGENTLSVSSNEDVAAAAETYTATAYSLRGRTASGRFVSRGVIAADPAVLPLGTRVRLEAGSFSGEYVVADTGGSVRGRRVDIWTPSTREAMRFGRRHVKLTVLSFGARKPKDSQGIEKDKNPTTSTSVK